MVTLSIILSVSIIINIIIAILYFSEKKDFKKRESEFVNSFSIRTGIYVYQLSTSGDNSGKSEAFTVDVHITEQERYTNGKSKIMIDHLDIGNYPNTTETKSIKKYIIEQMPELINTSDIEWLELVDSLQKTREKKLERILKDIKE